MTGWVVECEDYRTKPLPTKEAAEARIAHIERLGICDREHRVVEK